MKETVLVTGGAGYIGSHVCKALSKHGYHPVVIDNLVYGHEWAVKWGPLVKGDIADRSIIDAAIKKHQPCAVIHLAAFAYVGESVENPARYYRNNIGGALSLLESMVENGIKKIVFSSSCATYGIPEMIPIKEDLPLRPINPYGHTKVMVEQMLQDFSAAYGLQYISLRYFNAAGADPDAEIGELHEPETHLIPNILKAAYGEIPAVTIFGDTHETEDGTCIRDYIHVSDLAEAHVLALSALDKKTTGPFNLGTGKGHSVKEVVKAAESLTKRTIPFEIKPERAGDPPKLAADASRANDSLCWKPGLCAIETIVQTAIEWRLKTLF
jgi:UDP-arabinose 4-epimerase